MQAVSGYYKTVQLFMTNSELYIYPDEKSKKYSHLIVLVPYVYFSMKEPFDIPNFRTQYQDYKQLFPLQIELGLSRKHHTHKKKDPLQKLIT
mmetsp:Transcript_38052/g.58086  ORF Transcript_38052/g.58086 Transcript_38052/m.58086 type:complete len:92 (-) Transcript_38052:16-291(-)